MTLPQPPLGLELPILQAPTGSVAGPELCAAISMAGAMGAMGLTWTAPEDAVRFVRQVRAATTRPFLVNFALAFEPHALGLVLEAGAPVIAFSWGDPSELVPMVRASGALFGIQVSNLDGAKRALSLGADFLIAQGVEAGGHVQSTTPLLTLLESVLPVTGATPVIAAGGLATGRDIGNVLRLGAAGAMLGTRFVATRESRAHDVYRERLVAESRTALTCCFDGGWPSSTSRVLRNSTLENWEAAGCPPPGRRPGEGDIIAGNDAMTVRRYDDTAPRAGMSGNIEAMSMYAGCGVGSIRDVPSAADLVKTLWEEALRAI